MKGLIEFGCSGQQAIRRRHKWSRGWRGRHLATQEQGALARNSGNPPPTIRSLEELQQGPGWVAWELPAPDAQGAVSVWVAGAKNWFLSPSIFISRGWFLSPGIFICKGSMATAVDRHPQRPTALRSQPQELCAPEP